MGESIIEKLNGKKGIRQLVIDFYIQIMADPSMQLHLYPIGLEAIVQEATATIVDMLENSSRAQLPGHISGKWDPAPRILQHLVGALGKHGLAPHEVRIFLQYLALGSDVESAA